ncbi:MAG: hypothetical protein GWN07_14695 [Actinobacteria bacterium]|nr:hypothetical protein [Actinomycetota bacterium]NIU66725.1 hypothetical protein [Actinomycetota bacterium]NIV87376.1 hypothetical protein [Actinomycetota bacterium]NIW28526.1 hypothetical protein [Actinomycetota bacterium]NIX21010.1 hypothetical protein [Actinomycetota bacterium]
MAEPRVPGSSGKELELPCGETVHTHDLDLGMRALACDCGDVHAVVMDVHPPERFLPEFLVEALREAVETADELGEFGTPHLMGLVLEEFPGEVAVADASDDGHVGYALVWVTGFDDRRLHEVIVELVVELMEHAVSHAEDEAAVSEFEASMFEFDVAAFVEQYRAERDWSAREVPGADRG